MAVSIRVARAADAHDIAELTLQLGYKVAAHDVSERLSRILLRPDQQFFVAELDGQAIGWVHTVVTEFVESAAFVVIGGLVVDRAHRKRGIGSLLMERAEEWARTQGCSLVRLWSSSIRVEAHRFYEHLGYRNVKTQYSFVKPVDAAGQDVLRSLVPKVES